jgi:hypothetical protein
LEAGIAVVTYVSALGGAWEKTNVESKITKQTTITTETKQRRIR